MNAVQVEQQSYEMPPREGVSIAHFPTVADIDRSARFYEKVFGDRILSMGDGKAPGYLQLANIWMILNVGGGPTRQLFPGQVATGWFRLSPMTAKPSLWTPRIAHHQAGPHR